MATQYITAALLLRIMEPLSNTGLSIILYICVTSDPREG